MLIAYMSLIELDDRPSPFSIEGLVQKILFEGSIYHENESMENFCRSDKYLNGLEQINVYSKENLSIEQSRFIRLTSPNSLDYLDFRTIDFTEEFRPGSIIILEISFLPQISQTILQFEQQIINQFDDENSEFNRIVKKLTLVDLERVLYRSSAEEQADGKGFDVYFVPDHGQLVYCGIQGQMSLLDNIRLYNQFDHPLMKNLKQGNWLMDYISRRLQLYSNTKEVRFKEFSMNK